MAVTVHSPMEDWTMRIRTLIYCALLCSTAPAISAMAQDAILPHGDPRARDTDAEAARREVIRDEHMKQQGQGPNYRIEGELQGNTDDSLGSRERPAPQDTGLSDPSVNPGQASGMREVRGRIIKSEEDVHTVRMANGQDATLKVDANTTGDKDLRPGDEISGTMTPQGRAVTLHKEKASPR
jgi:hypothetical protein